MNDTMQVSPCTEIKFNPPVFWNNISKNDRVPKFITERYQCISTMDEYQHKSLEEMRYEHYTANGKNATLQRGGPLTPFSHCNCPSTFLGSNSRSTFPLSNPPCTCTFTKATPSAFSFGSASTPPFSTGSSSNAVRALERPSASEFSFGNPSNAGYTFRDPSSTGFRSHFSSEFTFGSPAPIGFKFGNNSGSTSTTSNKNHKIGISGASNSQSTYFADVKPLSNSSNSRCVFSFSNPPRNFTFTNTTPSAFSFGRASTTPFSTGSSLNAVHVLERPSASEFSFRNPSTLSNPSNTGYNFGTGISGASNSRSTSIADVKPFSNSSIPRKAFPFSNPPINFTFTNPTPPVFNFGSTSTAPFNTGFSSNTVHALESPSTSKFTFSNPSSTGNNFGTGIYGTSSCQSNSSTADVEPNCNLPKCIICVEKEREILFAPCGHLIVCKSCSNSIRHTCPMCNVRIKQKIKSYIS